MPRPLSRRRKVWIIGAVGIAVAIVLLLSLVPVSHPFVANGLLVVADEIGCIGVTIPRGAPVNFHWVAPSNVYAFGVWSCSNNSAVYLTSGGHNGSGSFVSTGGTYEFAGACPAFARPPSPYCIAANVTGTYSSPTLIWP